MSEATSSPTQSDSTAVEPPSPTEPARGPHSWFEPSLPAAFSEREPEDEAFVRLWHSFMSVRVLMALAITLLQLLAHGLGQPLHPAVPLLCASYLAATLAVRLLARPRKPQQTFGRQWLFTAGIDLLVYSLLQLLQPGALNYTPLFALPLLLVSVLGSLALALGTAAVVTLLLLAGAWWTSLSATADDGTARLLAVALIGGGYFLVALLVNQLAARLAREQRRSRHSHIAASLQSQVNELVIDALADGVAVVDREGIVRAANPAARLLLGSARGELQIPFALAAEPAWWALLERVQAAFKNQNAPAAEVSVQHADQGQRRLRVRTRLTSNRIAGSDGLCVVFLHDLRETEARLRTEKLAAMGRMSSAVAHEIRNPLAAIVQANALLDEDIVDPAQKRLTAMVRQNAQRLSRITEEVLDISRVQRQLDLPAAAAFALDPAVGAICAEWKAHQRGDRAVEPTLGCGGTQVRFDPEHLRRVLVNLLDNAHRHAQPHPDSLQVRTCVSDAGETQLSVWSEGAPLEPAVEQHLFEPFFSSESRSTGLGLYICRELCERHAASIGYQRERRETARGEIDGNAFMIEFGAVAAPTAGVIGPLQLDLNLA